jgi:hypothetical protein
MPLPRSTRIRELVGLDAGAFLRQRCCAEQARRQARRHGRDHVGWEQRGPDAFAHLGRIYERPAVVLVPESDLQPGTDSGRVFRGAREPREALLILGAGCRSMPSRQAISHSWRSSPVVGRRSRSSARCCHLSVVALAACSPARHASCFSASDDRRRVPAETGQSAGSALEVPAHEDDRLRVSVRRRHGRLPGAPASRASARIRWCMATRGCAGLCWGGQRQAHTPESRPGLSFRTLRRRPESLARCRPFSFRRPPS